MGFPTRILRSFLGPYLRNMRPIENPEMEVPAEALNSAFHQLAGMNLIVPRASVLAAWTGSTFAISHQGEAWNPNGDQPHPELERSGAGQYTYTFETAYLDEAGISLAINLTHARVTSGGAQAAYADRITAAAWRDPSDATVVHVRLWDASGTAVDAPFWLEVF